MPIRRVSFKGSSIRRSVSEPERFGPSTAALASSVQTVPMKAMDHAVVSARSEPTRSSAGEFQGQLRAREADRGGALKQGAPELGAAARACRGGSGEHAQRDRCLPLIDQGGEARYVERDRQEAGERARGAGGLVGHGCCTAIDGQVEAKRRDLAVGCFSPLGRKRGAMQHDPVRARQALERFAQPRVCRGRVRATRSPGGLRGPPAEYGVGREIGQFADRRTRPVEFGLVEHAGFRQAIRHRVGHGPPLRAAQ